MIQLTTYEVQLRAKANQVCREYKRLEYVVLELLQEIERSKFFKKLNYSSLFQYSVQELELSEAVAYAFISVARKARAVPALQDALREQKISVSKASRIVPGLNAENASTLIPFARSHTSRQIDFEMARLNPRARARDKIKPLSEDLIQITVSISKEAYENLKRAEDLKGAGPGAVIEASLSEYVERHDPVKKARRALERQAKRTKTTEELRLNRVKQSGRVRLTANEKYAVAQRDKGRCTHVDMQGKRCTNERWLETHHIVKVADGGSNDLKNLTTLCSFHHDLVHQLSLPIDGQITWLRSTVREYRAG